MTRFEPVGPAGQAGGTAGDSPPWRPPAHVHLPGEPSRSWEGRPVDPWRREWRLPALCVFQTTPSTNDVARLLAEAGAPAGTTVLAEGQTAGRGRVGRSWLAPPGSSLLISIVLRPATRAGDEFNETGIAGLPLLIGLAAAEACDAFVRTPVTIKWPNDLLVDGRKTAGILCEAAMTASGEGFVIAGIGINVNQAVREFPPELRESATSLAIAAGEPVPRADVATRLLDRLRPLFRPPATHFDPGTLNQLRDRDALFGLDVEIEGRHAGTACGIAADGALMVRTPTGGLASIRAGTVRILHG